MPYHLCDIAINGTSCWTALLLWLQVVWKGKKRMHCINILIMKISILVIYKKNQNINQSVHNCSEKISIFYWFVKRGYTHYKWLNWCSCSNIAMEKVILIVLHQKWLGLAVMGKYYSKLLMLFNLAFLIKCKYMEFKNPSLKYVGCYQPGQFTFCLNYRHIDIKRKV